MVFFKKQFAMALCMALPLCAQDPDLLKYSHTGSATGVSSNCCGSLHITKACIKKLKSHKISAEKLRAVYGCANQFNVDDLSAQSLRVDNACANHLNAGNICANAIHGTEVCATEVNAPKICSDNAQLHNVCAQNIVTQDLCVNGTFKTCSKYGARVLLSSDVTYTLGDVIPYDLVVSDPSGSFFFGPSRFVAPVTGTYILTTEVDQIGLSSPVTILGAPLTELQVQVNGINRVNMDSQLLTFASIHEGLLTSLIFLNAGDVLTIRKNIFIVDQVLGFTPIVGTVTLKGSAVASDKTNFYIEFLGAPCETTVPCSCPVEPCAPCLPCNVVPCEPAGPCNFAPCPCPPCGS
ncbi:MAG: hypothetical protein WC707_06070 [Candidatus Babeliaceae bacterium]|jgi:hypothetical protein